MLIESFRVWVEMKNREKTIPSAQALSHISQNDDQTLSQDEQSVVAESLKLLAECVSCSLSSCSPVKSRYSRRSNQPIDHFGRLSSPKIASMSSLLFCLLIELLCSVPGDQSIPNCLVIIVKRTVPRVFGNYVNNTAEVDELVGRHICGMMSVYEHVWVDADKIVWRRDEVLRGQTGLSRWSVEVLESWNLFQSLHTKSTSRVLPPDRPFTLHVCPFVFHLSVWVSEHGPLTYLWK
jgi:hypothetical protein